MNGATFTEKTKFDVVSKMLDRIYSQNSRDRKKEIMRQFIKSFREQSKNHPNDNFYPILRLILPQLERERGPYGIKEYTLAKIYIRILCLAKDSKDAQKLLHYRNPKTGSKIIGDFAEVAFYILRSRFENGGTLTVADVNTHLDNIATKHASHDPSGVDKELQTMITKMSPEEQKWLIRILLKDLNLGLSQNTILGLFHYDAVDLYDVSNDLQKVCVTLKDPSIRLHEISISLFEPFKPMLSQRCDVQNVQKDLKSSDHYYVETKFDGERFQIHCENGEFKYFSRNGHEYTNCYGCNSSNGVLTPKLSTCLSTQIRSCILDGEMMCWHKKRKCFTTKGMNIDVKFIKDADSHQACFCVFDILLLNGAVVTNKPYVERVKLLENNIKPEEGVLMISKRIRVTSADDILNSLNKAIVDCEEGIVIKEPYSVYKPNSRKAGWYKIKPEYTEGVMVELDLLIIGGYYGEGRRKGLVSQFLLGLANPLKNAEEEPISFYPVCRVGSGYSDDELSELNQKLQGNWKRAHYNSMPAGIEWTREKPDVWIEPRLSYILQIKATEIVPSDIFKINFTLRFPRVQKIRYDKPWTDCLTHEEFINLKESTLGKLCGNYAMKISPDAPKKQIKRPKKTFAVDDECVSKKRSNIELSSSVFEEREFCVITGHETLSKSELETRIIQNGGLIVQHPGPNTFSVISSNANNIRAKNVIKLNKYNVIKANWLLECIDTNMLKEWNPNDFLALAPEMAEKMSDEYDENGDSYTELLQLDGLKRIMNGVKDSGDLHLEDAVSLDRALFGTDNPFALFRGCFAAFLGIFENENHEHKIRANTCKEIFKFFGGCVEENVNDKTTHAVYFKRGSFDHIQENEIQLNGKISCVNEEWILDSWKAEKRLCESKYYHNPTSCSYDIRSILDF